MSSVNKFTEQPSYEEIVQKMQDIIDALGSATGANINLSNLSATGEAHFQAPLNYTPVNRSGDTMTGALYVPTPATNSNGSEAATTAYVHKQVQGGKIACNGSTATWVAFPTTFPSDNVAIAIVRKASDTATGGTYVPFVRQHYSSGFNLYNPTSGAQTVFWVATWLG